MKFKILKNKSGFTLIEILVAMSITMLIATAFFMINNIVIKSNFKSERDIESLMIAQSILESTREGIKVNNSESINIQIDTNLVINVNRNNIPSKSEDIESTIDTEEKYNILKFDEDNSNDTNIQLIISKQNKKYNTKLYIAKIGQQDNENNLYDIVVKVKLEEAMNPSKEVRLQTYIYEK